MKEYVIWISHYCTLVLSPQIKEYEKLDSEEERLSRSRQIYDGYIMKELLSCSHVRLQPDHHTNKPFSHWLKSKFAVVYGVIMLLLVLSVLWKISDQDKWIPCPVYHHRRHLNSLLWFHCHFHPAMYDLHHNWGTWEIIWCSNDVYSARGLTHSVHISMPNCVCILQPFSKKAVDHVQCHLAKKQVPPSLFQVRHTEPYLI